MAGHLALFVFVFTRMLCRNRFVLTRDQHHINPRVLCCEGYQWGWGQGRHSATPPKPLPQSRVSRVLIGLEPQAHQTFAECACSRVHRQNHVTQSACLQGLTHQHISPVSARALSPLLTQPHTHILVRLAPHPSSTLVVMTHLIDPFPFTARSPWLICPLHQSLWPKTRIAYIILADVKSAVDCCST